MKVEVVRRIFVNDEMVWWNERMRKYIPKGSNSTTKLCWWWSYTLLREDGEYPPSIHLPFSFSCLSRSQQTLHLLFLQSLNPHQRPSWSWSRQRMGEAESKRRMENNQALPPPLPWNSWKQQAKQSHPSWNGDGTRWRRRERGFETVRYASGDVNEDLDWPADSGTNAEGEG